uniref:Uncharacterized protein n=1 Tax=Mola mola TaxID=94237 RepID=A0A3Q4BQZ7_MOLML
MKTCLTLLLLKSGVFCCSACEGHALKCHTCMASNEDECNRQGSSPCPQHTDVCSTITGPNTVIKFCAYSGFCSKAPDNSFKMKCCSGDDCNGPHNSHSHTGGHNGVGALASSPVLLITALLLRTAFSRL